MNTTVVIISNKLMGVFSHFDPLDLLFCDLDFSFLSPPALPVAFRFPFKVVSAFLAIRCS
jgi:hypothetical protein